MANAKRFRWLLLCAISAIFFGGIFFTSIGCGGLFGICSYVLEEPPPPVPDSFRRTGLGFGMYTDGSGTWQEPIPDSVASNVDEQFKKIVRCAENKLDAEIHITIEPAEKIKLAETQSATPVIEIMHMSSVFHSADMSDEELANIHPDEYPPDMFLDAIGSTARVDEYEELSVMRSRVLEGTIKSDFMIILSDKNACILNEHANGLTGSFDGHPTVWVNELGQLVGHEIEHVLANVLNLTKEEEESLYSCTPDINHIG